MRNFVPCEATFRHLATEDPNVLLEWIRSGELRDSDLTLAAEAVGLISDGEAVRTTLFPLLNHTNAVVREGAIIGIAEHADAAVTAKLRSLAERDSSTAIRTVALEALRTETT